MRTFTDQFTQTLITLEDFELLIQGKVSKKKLIIDTSDAFDVTVPTQVSAELNRDYQSRTSSNELEILIQRNGTHVDCGDADSRCKQINIKTAGIVNEDKISSRKKIAQNRSEAKDITEEKTCSNTATVTNDSIHLHTTEVNGQQCMHKLRILTLFDSSLKQIKATDVSSRNSDHLAEYKCQSCAKQFSSSKSLRTHSWIHEREKEYCCETCGKKFLRAHELCIHRRIHTGEKPFCCVSCKKCFTNSSALTRHQLIHRRENIPADAVNTVHRCPVCGKAFSQKGNLTVHMKIHTRTFNHVCSTCQKAFITSGDLKRHLRVHSKEKPYTCPACQKSYTTSSSLVYHMRVHKGERPYLCVVCGASFTVLGHLKQHNRIHARGDLWPRKKGTNTEITEINRTKEDRQKAANRNVNSDMEVENRETKDRPDLCSK